MTKIIISESESYEIVIPEKIDRTHLDFLILRLSHIQKLMGKDPFIKALSPNLSKREQELSQSQNGKLKELMRLAKNDRNLTLRFMKAYYSQDETVLESLLKELGVEQVLDRPKVGIYFRKFRLLHEIKPEEVGLPRYPRPGENVANVIKSMETTNGSSA